MDGVLLTVIVCEVSIFECLYRMVESVFLLEDIYEVHVQIMYEIRRMFLSGMAKMYGMNAQGALYGPCVGCQLFRVHCSLRLRGNVVVRFQSGNVK